MNDLAAIAHRIVAGGRGILAADERPESLEKRFKPVGIPPSPDNQRAYRELLFTTPGVAPYIGGVILYGGTLAQSTADGTPFPELLTGQGILPGVKVDEGVVPLAGAEGETITEGLDGLRERLAEYRALGARFTKWRATIVIGGQRPSPYAVRANAQALARYAALSQEAGLVPIVEPEVLMDGDHGIARDEEVTETTLRAVFHELPRHRVALEGMLLKPNMVTAGKDHPRSLSPQQVAEATVRCLRRTVPAAVAGIVFLSGGQSEVEATSNLNAINALGPHPWEVGFSYGRALQASAIAAWRGKAANMPAAQQAYLHRARCNSLARAGRYTQDAETAPS